MSAYDEVYKKEIADNRHWWSLQGIDKIIGYLEVLTVNFIIYRLGECVAVSSAFGAHPYITVELYADRDQPRSTSYYIGPGDALRAVDFRIRGIQHVRT